MDVLPVLVWFLGKSFTKAAGIPLGSVSCYIITVAVPVLSGIRLCSELKLSAAAFDYNLLHT